MMAALAQDWCVDGFVIPGAGRQPWSTLPLLRMGPTLHHQYVRERAGEGELASQLQLAYPSPRCTSADQGHILAVACVRHGEDPTIPSDETLDGAISFIEFWRVNLQGEHKGANLEMVAVVDSGRVLDMTFHPNPGAVGLAVRYMCHCSGLHVLLQWASAHTAGRPLLGCTLTVCACMQSDGTAGGGRLGLLACALSSGRVVIYSLPELAHLVQHVPTNTAWVSLAASSTQTANVTTTLFPQDRVPVYRAFPVMELVAATYPPLSIDW